MNWLWKRAQAKLGERCQQLDTEHPSLNLKAHKHNFRAAATDFEESSLNPAKTLGGHGAHFGRWAIKLRERKPMTLQLETLTDMQAAYEGLGECLGGMHQVNVAWSPSKGVFVKRGG